MRTAIIGTRGIARAHAEAATAPADRIDLVAAMDVDPLRLEAFREKYGVGAGYTDVDEMLAREKPDVACTGQAVERGSITRGDPFYEGMAHVLAHQTA